MELYLFSKDRSLAGVVEAFEYLRWSRRYSFCGSFELKAVATKSNLDLLQMGNILWKNDDEEAGIIEYIELTMQEQEYVIVKGRFATGLLSRRIIWGTEILQGDLSVGVRQLLTNHVLNPNDDDRRLNGIGYQSESLSVPINTQISYKNLLTAVENLCGTSDVGLKTAFDPKSRMFTVSLYKGFESQAVFSKEYENILEQVYMQSELDYANTALIGGEGEGSERIFVNILSSSGESRYETFVDAKDLRSEDFGSDYENALTFRGESRLSELAKVHSFDATINQHGNLTYKTDFDLGQLVRVVSKKWGVNLVTRITEIEESYDRDGQSINIVFGRGVLTIFQKLKGGI